VVTGQAALSSPTAVLCWPACSSRSTLGTGSALVFARHEPVWGRLAAQPGRGLCLVFNSAGALPPGDVRGPGLAAGPANCRTRPVADGARLAPVTTGRAPIAEIGWACRAGPRS
jgi:hypothetical protein